MDEREWRERERREREHEEWERRVREEHERKHERERSEHWHHYKRHHHPPRADGIVFTFHRKHHKPKRFNPGEHMQENLSVGQTVPVIGAAAIGGDPTITQAALSVQVYTSSDQSVFTVVPDTTTAGGAIITAIANGTATLLETATATEADGTSHQVQGVATIVIAPAVVIVPPADGIVFTFGTPSGL